MSSLLGIKKKTTRDNRYIRMKARRDSRCAECEDDIYEDDEFIYDSAESKGYCMKCGEELMK